MSENVTESMKSDQLWEPDLCGRTKLKNLNFVYEWCIDEFKSILDRDYEIPSPDFTSDEGSQVKWKLILFPAHKYPDGVHLAIRLMKVSAHQNPSSVKYIISLVNKLGEIHEMESREKLFTRFADYDDCTLLSHLQLVEGHFLPQNCLTIRCKMQQISCVNEVNGERYVSKENLSECNEDSLNSSVLNENEKYKCSTPKSSNYHKYNIVDEDVKVENSEQDELGTIVQNSLGHLSDNLKDLYITKDFSDVTISTDDTEIRAHKAILSARSDYLKSICAECNGSKITFDVKSTVMENVLFYLYTGKVRPVSVELCLDLLSAAKKFRLFHLQELVIDIIRDNITVNNVTDILQLCESLNLRELKNDCLKYANSKHSDLVRTDKWKRMIKNNPHIAGEVLLTIASFKKSNIL